MLNHWKMQVFLLVSVNVTLILIVLLLETKELLVGDGEAKSIAEGLVVSIVQFLLGVALTFPAVSLTKTVTLTWPSFCVPNVSEQLLPTGDVLVKLVPPGEPEVLNHWKMQRSKLVSVKDTLTVGVLSVSNKLAAGVGDE